MSEEYDYRLDVESAERTDEIPETKILLAQSNLTENEAKKLFEKEKTEIFKGIFRRPKESDVEIKSIKKSFDPYLILGGKYEIRYLTERQYDVNLLDDTVSVFILGEELLVKKEQEKEAETEVEIKTEKKKGLFDGLFDSFGKKKVVEKPELQLDGIEHVYIDNEIMEARNYNGLSINPDSLADAEFTEVGKDFLKNEAAFIPTDYIDMESFVSEIIEEYAVRPEHAKRVIYEKLAITDKKIIFYPVYWAEMVYKESKTKQVRIDAVTKKIHTPKGTRYAPPPDGAITDDNEDEKGEDDSLICPGCGEKVSPEDTFCPDCGVKL